MSFPKTLTYKILNQKNSEYDPDRLLKQRLIFSGGQEIIDNAELFINQGLESDTAYNAKLKCACYKNFFANICNDYNSTLFTHQLLIHPAFTEAADSQKSLEDLQNGPYGRFAADADNCGNNLNYILSEVLNTAFYHERAYVGIDFPVAEDKPVNKLSEKRLNLDKPYIYLIDTASVLDWSCDNKGKFNFIVQKRVSNERDSFLDSRDSTTVEFKVWQKQEGKVEYAVYQAKIDENNKLNDETAFNIVKEDEVDFKEIPIVCFTLPPQLYLYGLIGTLCSNIYDRYSTLLFAQNQALVAIPFFTMGAEFPTDDALSDIGSDPNRKNYVKQALINKGFAIGGPDDKLEFVEPEGKSYEIVYKQIKDDIDQAYHIANQMGNTISQASSGQGKQRSGASKQLDQQAKENALSALGYCVKQLALKLYYLASEAKNEDIVWSAHGLDNYHLEDREVLIKEASLINLINIPSDTFKTLYLSELAEKLLETEAPGQNEIIKQEIAAGIKEFNEEMDHAEEKETEEETVDE